MVRFTGAKYIFSSSFLYIDIINDICVIKDNKFNTQKHFKILNHFLKTINRTYGSQLAIMRLLTQNMDNYDKTRV